MEKLDLTTDGSSMDIVQDNIAKLKQLFPDVFSEGKIDFEKLQDTLGDVIEDKEERYNFTWHGKAQAKRIAQSVSTGTLLPCKEESKHWDSTQNLFIEGDNLEVLKLLQKSYHNQVKMIYIDPPYNTGGEFIYPDNYHDNLDTYMQYTGQKDSEGRKFGTNADTSGRYHTNWLNMMYPRLKLARNLLQDDGVIFISIDDNEQSNLKKMCDEIFGEENFITNIIWRSSDSSNNDSKQFSTDYNHTLVYSKNIGWESYKLERSIENNSHYKNPDNDPNGSWFSGNISSPNPRINLTFDIVAPNGNIIKPPANGWRWKKEKIDEMVARKEIIFSDDQTRIIKKTYLKNQGGIVPSNIWWDIDDTGHNRNAKYELIKIFNELKTSEIFKTPKPTKFIKKILKVSSGKESIILDFFAGSATTAHAVMGLNSQDKGNRKYIMVQLPEPCDEKTESYNAGYKTIADIGKERIRRAGEKVQKDNANKEGIENLDIGFKVFKLDSSNIKSWDADFDNLEDTLLSHVDNIKQERSEEDVLYEILLKYGLNLTVPIEERIVNGKIVYIIGFGALIICLDNEITLDVVDGIGALKNELEPEVMRVVFKDGGFKDDVVKTNAIQNLKRFGIDDVKSL